MQNTVLSQDLGKPNFYEHCSLRARVKYMESRLQVLEHDQGVAPSGEGGVGTGGRLDKEQQ